MSYDPTIGRWTAEDPIAFNGGDVNLYRYVNNGPTDAIDPSGLLSDPIQMRPVPPTELPITNPRNLFVLVGPPNPANADNPLGSDPCSVGGAEKYYAMRGVPKNHILRFNSPDQYLAALERLRAIKKQDGLTNIDVHLLSHQSPGSVGMGTNDDGSGINANPENQLGWAVLSQPLVPVFINPDGSVGGSLYLSGCNSRGRINPRDGERSGRAALQNLFDLLGVPVYGNIGYVGFSPGTGGLMIEIGGTVKTN